MSPNGVTPPPAPSPNRRTLAVLALLAAAVALVIGCSSSQPETTTPAGTTAKTLETLPTTTSTTEGPSTSKQPTTTTIPTTTTTLPKINGTFEVKPSAATGSWPYPPIDQFSSPTLSWNVTVDPGQTVAIHGAAPGTPDAQLSTVTNGSFTLCPGSIDTVAANCTVNPGRYDYTIDIKNPDGSIATTKTVTLRVG